MAPKLELAFTIRSYVPVKETIVLGAVKGGLVRSIATITHGYIKGSGLDAKILPGSGDVALSDPATGVSHLDVHVYARTASGETFYVTYEAIMKSDEKLKKILSGEDTTSTNFGDHDWFNSLKIETSDKAFKWVETTFFVGRGRAVVDGDEAAAEYEIYKVVN